MPFVAARASMWLQFGRIALLALLSLSPWSLDAADAVVATPEAPVVADDPLAKLPEAQRTTIARLLELHNAERARNGRGALRAQPQLCAAAQVFAEHMNKTGAFGHSADGRSPGSRIAAQGYLSGTWAENIADGATTPDEAVRLWINSSGHHQNMLGRYTEVGFGAAGGKWVAVFAVP